MTIIVPDLRLPGDADDTASFQRAFDKALGHNLQDARDDERHQKILVPAIGRDYFVSHQFGISISGDFSAPILFEGEGTGSRIRNTNQSSDTLIIENTGGGNLRNWSVANMAFAWGKSAIRLKKAHYGDISKILSFQQWATALDLETNGDAATINMSDLLVYEQRGDSIRWVSGKFRINDSVFGEMTGAMRGLSGELELNNCRIFGTALNEVKPEYFPANDPARNNSAWLARNPNVGGALFALHGGAALTIEASEIDTVASCKTLIYAERAKNIYLDADIKLAAGTDTLIAQGSLYGNADNHLIEANLRPLQINGDTYLYRKMVAQERTDRRFRGAVQCSNGSQVLQDVSAPIAQNHLIFRTS